MRQGADWNSLSVIVTVNQLSSHGWEQSCLEISYLSDQGWVSLGQYTQFTAAGLIQCLITSIMIGEQDAD